jgi:hypothetical protein
VTFTIVCAVIALAVAAWAKGTRRTFCLLWALVLVVWAAFHSAALSKFHGLSGVEFSIAFTFYYVTCFALNFILLIYIRKHPDCEYKLIAIPIMFYAFLSLCVAIDNLLLQYGYAYYLFVEASQTTNVIEIILLLGADHGIRRRWATTSYASMYRLQFSNLFKTMGS